MLILKSVTLYRGGRPLFKSVNLTINPGQKVGMIGANGVGKSSLFALLRGELHADAGDIEIPKQTVIAHVAQETPALERSAIDYVMDGDRELRLLESKLSEMEHHHDGMAIAKLYSDYEHIGGYTAQSRAAELLHGLGFNASQHSQPLTTFSGGWRMRLNLAQALMCRSDLLLLDEPTNHLDMETVVWLEGWLRSYPGTLLLISHDRDFLDAVVNGIAYMGQETILYYTGNYSAYEMRRAEQLSQQQALYEKQQREVNHLQHFIDRFRAKATKARQAQSRIKALERMELIAPAHVDSPFSFTFKPAPKAANPLLAMEGVALGYQQTALLQNIKLSLPPGSRVGLLGPNGAGKSTLIKHLAGELNALNGVTTVGQGVRIGYFAQHQLEQLHPRDSALQHLIDLSPNTSEQTLRNFLGSFGFNDDQATTPIAPFSGGEKSRLALALIVWQQPNLLLLDEPTNHLDLEVRHALTLALQDFEGAMLVVSHDRHLLRTTTDEFWLVSEGSVSPFAGDLEDYYAWLAESRRQANKAAPAARAPSPTPAPAPTKSTPTNTSKASASRLKKLESELERVQKQLTTLEQILAEPDMYTAARKAELNQHLAEQQKLQQQQAQLESEWFDLQS